MIAVVMRTRVIPEVAGLHSAGHTAASRYFIVGMSGGDWPLVGGRWNQFWALAD